MMDSRVDSPDAAAENVMRGVVERKHAFGKKQKRFAGDRVVPEPDAPRERRAALCIHRDHVGAGFPPGCGF